MQGGNLLTPTAGGGTPSKLSNSRDRTPPNLLRLNVGGGGFGFGQSSATHLSLERTSGLGVPKSSARERSPVPSLEQAVTDKLKAMNDLEVCRKEMRLKEQEYTKKIAVLEQRIDLLQIQLRETDERETNQKKMYDRMFQALEDGNHGVRDSLQLPSSSPSSGRSNHRDRELDQLNKQFQEQQAERVKELETLVMTKEQEIAQFRINEIQIQQRHQIQMDELLGGKKEREVQMQKLEKSLKERDYELERLSNANRRLEDEVKHLSEKLSTQEKQYQQEYDKKLDDLKSMYSEQIDKQKRFYLSSQNDQDVIEQLKDELRKLAHEKIMQEEAGQRLESQVARAKDKNRELKSKVQDLEQSEKRLATALAERDRELEREKNLAKTRGQKLEHKLQKKKEKIRQMIFDFQEKEQEVEKMRVDMQSMREKLRALGLRVSSNSNLENSQYQKRSKSMLPQQQECDFEDCMEEDCVDVNGGIQSERRSSSDHQMNTAQVNELLKRGSESPLIRGDNQSEVKRSFSRAAGGDVASYLTPNRSSSKSQTNSQQAQSVFAIENIYKMIENCVKMECTQCRKLIPTHLFYDHITIGCENVQKSGMIGFLSKSQEGQKLLGGTASVQPYYLTNQQIQLFFGQNAGEEDLKTPMQPANLMQFLDSQVQPQTELNTERTSQNTKMMFLEEKLRKADELLRESAIEIKNLREERERLRLESDRLRLTLDQTATQLALVEEQKAETELDMKREIKYLLEQWIFAKNQSQNQSQQSSQSQRQKRAPQQERYAHSNNSYMVHNDNNNYGSHNDNMLDDDASAVIMQNDDDLSRGGMTEMNEYRTNTSSHVLYDEEGPQIAQYHQMQQQKLKQGNQSHQSTAAPASSRPKSSNPNNQSIITNYNPLTALETQDNAQSTNNLLLFNYDSCQSMMNQQQQQPQQSQRQKSQVKQSHYTSISDHEQREGRSYVGSNKTLKQGVTPSTHAKYNNEGMGGNGLQDITSQQTNGYQTAKPFTTALVLDNPTTLQAYQKHTSSITPAHHGQYAYGQQSAQQTRGNPMAGMQSASTKPSGNNNMPRNHLYR